LAGGRAGFAAAESTVNARLADVLATTAGADEVGLGEGFGLAGGLADSFGMAPSGLLGFFLGLAASLLGVAGLGAAIVGRAMPFLGLGNTG